MKKKNKTTAMEMYLESIQPYLQIENFKERQIRLAIAANLFGEDDFEKVLDELEELRIEHSGVSDEYDYFIMVGSIIHGFIDKLKEIGEGHSARNTIDD